MVRVLDNMRVRLVLAVALVLALAAGVVALSAGAAQRTSNDLSPLGVAAPNVNGPCPSAPLRVLAVENFYGNIVQQLGGQCVTVTTILADPDADPHEFEPSADDVRAFSGASLVIENGLGYDDFADKVIATLSRKPAIVRAGDVLGLQVGANPHVWYSSRAIDQITAATLTELRQLEPGASAYFDRQAAALDMDFSTYRQLVAQIADEFGGTPVGATESIVAELTEATGLQLLTPPEFMNALSEGNDPSAQDLATFQDQIRSKQIRVLVYNVQTVTPITTQLEDMAQQNGIPVVGVSETMPPGAQTFQGWQAAQLQLLLNALRQSAER
jgi:zinc/manganese transport system substrate-binding protein